MCADIHDGREHKRSFKGRIQKRKTNHLQIIKSSLQRTAGPYKGATTGLMHRSKLECSAASWGPFKEFGLVANRSQPELFAGFPHYSAGGIP